LFLTALQQKTIAKSEGPEKLVPGRLGNNRKWTWEKVQPIMKKNKNSLPRGGKKKNLGDKTQNLPGKIIHR